MLERGTDVIIAALGSTISHDHFGCLDEESLRWAPEGSRFAPLSGCVGAADGTHVPFRPYGTFDPARWRNRKGYLSSNVMVLCNFDRRIVGLNVGYEGA